MKKNYKNNSLNLDDAKSTASKKKYWIPFLYLITFVRCPWPLTKFQVVADADSGHNLFKIIFF